MRGHRTTCWMPPTRRRSGSPRQSRPSARDGPLEPIRHGLRGVRCARVKIASEIREIDGLMLRSRYDLYADAARLPPLSARFSGRLQNTRPRAGGRNAAVETPRSKRRGRNAAIEAPRLDARNTSLRPPLRFGVRVSVDPSRDFLAGRAATARLPTSPAIRNRGRMAPGGVSSRV